MTSSLVSVVYLLLFITSCSGNFDQVFTNIKTEASTESQEKSINDLVKRILTEQDSELIKIKIDLQYATHTLLKTVNGKLEISSSNAVDAAYGFNHYLKYFCKKHISWAGDNLGELPRPLPPIKTVIKLKSGVKVRYYQNVCTSSYSFVWWDWKRWEREIDWMALNGINLPLAFTGQEMIWDRLYKSLGCSDQDMNNHFTGPAYLAWGRMGNVKAIGGPLSNSWKKQQLVLQHQILTRMRSLAMIPVLPAFAGHIPQCITKIFPTANYSVLEPWSKFNCTYSCTYLLDPNDPLFTKIGAMFISEQMKEYNGTNHIYNSDVFNEMTPKSSDVEYLASTSFAVYNAMVSADPKALWLMQGWLFYHASWFWKDEQIKALLTAVPKGRMIILDLFAESYPLYKTTNSFYGQPFIWCMLHNFGGNLGFYGKIDHLNRDPMEAYNSADSSMIGIGITPEGINQNYLVYELMLEIGYSLQSVDVGYWVDNFVERRYGIYNEHATAAWQIFARTVLNDTEVGKPSSKVLLRGPICKRPSLSIVGLPIWYDVNSQLAAWDHFMQGLRGLPDSETVRYDLVDITRQILVDIHRLLYYNILEAFGHDKSYSLLRLQHFGDMMMDLFDDLNRILSTNSHFTLENWIYQAKSAASTKQEEDLFEMNARQQITLWGENGEILDYADKHWSTLVSNYYKPRWSLFISFLVDAIKKGKDFNHKKFQHQVFTNVEKPFVSDRMSDFITSSTENTFQVAKEIYEKWRHLLPSSKSQNSHLMENLQETRRRKHFKSIL